MKLQFLKEILYFLKYRNFSGGKFSLTLSIYRVMEQMITNKTKYKWEICVHQAPVMTYCIFEMHSMFCLTTNLTLDRMRNTFLSLIRQE